MKKLIFLISFLFISSGLFSQKYSNFIDKDLLISNGNVKKMKSFLRFGHNPAVGAVEEDLWFAGGVYPFPSTAEYLRVAAGGDAADTIGGLGAQSVVVIYLDSFWVEQMDTLTLAGSLISVDSTSSKAWRMIRAYVLEVGAYGASNTGLITIQNAASGQTLGDIEATTGQTQISIFTVEAGWTAYLRAVEIVSGRGNGSDVVMYQRKDADDVVAPFTGKRIV